MFHAENSSTYSRNIGTNKNAKNYQVSYLETQ